MLSFLIALGEVINDESADEWLPDDDVINDDESLKADGADDDADGGGGLHVVSSILVKLFVVVVVVLTYLSNGKEYGSDTCTTNDKGVCCTIGTCFAEPLIGDEFLVKQHCSFGLLDFQ